MATLTESGIIGNFQGYPIQIVPVQPGDTLLVRVSNNLDVDDCNSLMKELKKEFPNNTILLSNEHILQGITVIRHDNMFEEYKNDFLH